MIPLRFLLFVMLILQACYMETERIDVKQAKELVFLTKNDLQNFSLLRHQLILDSIQLRKQEKETTTPSNRTSWMSTNSFYLNQIDSLKYTELFLKLKGKLVDKIKINSKGSVIFTIKENTQVHTDKDNECYCHQLVSVDCNCPIDKVFNKVDSIFLDSTLSRDWKYVSYKVLTGW